MNNAELADRLATSQELGKAEARRLLDAVLATIVDAAKSGEEVALSGFGRFKVTDRAARQGRNPQTGEAMEIAASRKLAFAPAKPVRDALNPAAGKASAKRAGGKTAAPASKVKGAAEPKAAAAPAPAKGKKAG
jgi:DNA-binding protein HU-beta